MKRVYIAIVLIVLCAVFCAVSYATVTKDCKALIAQAEKIETLAEQGENDALPRLGEAVKNDWNRYSFSFSLLTTHIHYDIMEECCDKLYHACRQKDKKDILNACYDLIFEAKHIITSIKPNFENTF